jgi:hypothetical protein
MSDPSVLPYAQPTTRRRFSRLAVLALLWSLLAPPAMLALLTYTADALDDLVHPRERLFLLFQALATAAPLTGVVLGSVAAGRIRARRQELRGLPLAVAAIVIGWLATVGLGWLCGEASTWG